MNHSLSDPFLDSRLADIERKANNAAPHHEIYEINRNVDSLERSVREARAEIDGLRAQLEAAQNALIQLQELVAQAMQQGQHEQA